MQRHAECSRDVRMQLQDFADQMLAGPYNKLMGQVSFCPLPVICELCFSERYTA